ncbi:hypothetical protein BHH77_25085, partial [Salmonella enterica]|nr:hypothetical protein [Salmonella enterica]
TTTPTDNPIPPMMNGMFLINGQTFDMNRIDFVTKLNDVGRILRTFKIKKNVEVTDNGKIII